MKFEVTKDNIFRTLSHIQGIVDKNNLPILSNILIEAKQRITLTSTDMDISIIEELHVMLL